MLSLQLSLSNREMSYLFSFIGFRKEKLDQQLQNLWIGTPNVCVAIQNYIYEDSTFKQFQTLSAATECYTAKSVFISLVVIFEMAPVPWSE